MQHTAPMILGAGYVGTALLNHFPAADATRRQAADAGPRRYRFDLEDPDTWNDVPVAGRAVVWTFPALPLARVQAYFERRLRDATSVIVLGSTSAYRLPDTPAVATVDEDTPLDLDQPRVRGEEWLREQGATVLQLAGIFGPGREPLDWLLRGRIRDGAKIVNLVHVDDIVAVIAHLVSHPAPGMRINVANGAPVAWRDLAARFRAESRLPEDFALAASMAGEHGKRIDVARLRALLPAHPFQLP